MKKFKRHQIPVLLGVVAALLASVLALSPVRTLAATETDLVRLEIDNRSSGNLYVWLEGPAVYYFAIQPENSESFALERGKYSYRFRACGDTVTGTLELPKQKKLVMPVCGGRATAAEKSPSGVDISSQIKIVKVEFENDASTRALVIMTGPTTYVFTFEEDEEKDYTIAKGDYKVQTFACGRYGTRSFTAFKGKTLVLDCP